jgi:hypothetical protein
MIEIIESIVKNPLKIQIKGRDSRDYEIELS